MPLQTYQIVSQFPTTLTPDDLVYVKAIVVEYLEDHEFVTNKILREIANVTYDQAIYFFGQMLKQKLLEKVGVGGATKYVLSKRKSVKR